MIANTTRKGKASEAVILSILVQQGKSVLIPWGEERYDLALDDDGRLVRIQCKTGVLRNGCVVFKTCITDARRPLGDGGYAGQIDAFAVFCPQLRRAYLVPIEALPSPNFGYLRVEPALNGQLWNIRWARDFELVAPLDVVSGMGTEHQADAVSELGTRQARLGDLAFERRPRD